MAGTSYRTSGRGVPSQSLALLVAVDPVSWVTGAAQVGDASFLPSIYGKRHRLRAAAGLP